MPKILILISILSLVGCSKILPPTSHPLSGTGTIKSHDWSTTIQGQPYIEVEYTDDHQIVDYELCADSQQPFIAGETVDLSFNWDARKGCYYVIDSFLVKEATK